MKPQLAKLIAYGEGMLERFGQNTGHIEPPTAEVKSASKYPLDNSQPLRSRYEFTSRFNYPATHQN